MKVIAIIPARSGSKGLKDKNIIDVNGKPLMWYTINAAIKSRIFDEIMVSTDSKEYAKVAVECGAHVPFLRSEKASSDQASSWDVVREVLINYSNRGQEFDYVMLLQPTSPLRDYLDIKKSFSMLEKKGNVVSVTPVNHPVQWCFPLDETLSLLNFSKSPYNQMRRQDLEKHYMENGAIYLVDAKKIMDINYNLYQDNCLAYIMDKEKSIDIDEEIDLLLVKAIMERRV